MRDQKSGLFKLESRGLREPQRIDRLLVVVIAGLAGSLQGYAVSLAGERRPVDPHWRRGLIFVRLGLKWLQQCVAHTAKALPAWAPIPLRDLGACIPSHGVRRRQKEPWFTHLDLPPRPRKSQPLAVA
ncbi:hypothetical protein FQK07_10270 [Synechococcus sp. BSF8S]|uniref:hypothetical protein n=1 Tax=Synechococcales TaxID=1890424 RepID=UPI0016297685|nr:MULTISPECIES: hypothetical protein [unclassified Synechococcus]MBC1261639.1 hypothetical protein [Synechococcus sp. BSF8S]MBC1264568.1 hypothetical protein [Synechococcus sp. BSA11S]